jgi:hypothetical protein
LYSGGYRIWLDDETDVYCAEKNSRDFIAESPCGLLGMVVMHEHKSPDRYVEYRRKDAGEHIFLGISHQPPGYGAG